MSEIFTTDDWETPPEKLVEAISRFNILPQMDVCATQKNKKCKLYIDRKLDFLKIKTIPCDFFMNPPYSNCGIFLRHAVEVAKKSKVNFITLVYCGMDTKWWHELVGDKIQYPHDFYFERGKIYFLRNGKRMMDLPSKGRARSPNVWLCWKFR